MEASAALKIALKLKETHQKHTMTTAQNLAAMYMELTLARFTLRAEHPDALRATVDAIRAANNNVALLTRERNAGTVLALYVCAVAEAMAAPGACVLVIKGGGIRAEDARHAIERIHAENMFEQDATMVVDSAAQNTTRMTVALPCGGTSVIYVSHNGLFGLGAVLQALRAENAAPTAIFADELILGEPTDAATVTIFDAVTPPVARPKSVVLVVHPPTRPSARALAVLENSAGTLVDMRAPVAA